MQLQELKTRISNGIDAHKEQIIAIGQQIFENPELGFKEEKTAALVAKTFQEIKIPFRDKVALTGVVGEANGKSADARVAILGELDAVVCPLHPCADDATGAAHSCGHNSQIAAMLGAAFGLVATGAMKYLDGSVVFMAVPAEEYVELEYRQKLKEQGKIRFFGGKQEFIRLGEFDGIDAGMMIHSHGGMPGRKLLLDLNSSGFVGKAVRYSGVEAHAGAAPHDGVNALNAAMLGMMGINAQRETFQEKDRVRVHPIITKGGDLVNIVPADVRMETYVRARTIEAVIGASTKVNRALRAGADMVGATVEIDEIPGYLPLYQDRTLTKLFHQNAAPIVGEENLLYGYELMGSTDAGDVSALMPFIHPSTGGYTGSAHSKNFAITDPEMAYVVPAKVMALTVADMLFDGAKGLEQVRASFKPQMTKDQYLEFWNRFIR